MINLTNMMEVSANKAKGGKGLDTALDDYHNQLHALLDSYGNVTKEQAKTPAYDLAITQQEGTHRRSLAVVEVQGRSTAARSAPGSLDRRAEGAAGDTADD